MKLLVLSLISINFVALNASASPVQTRLEVYEQLVSAQIPRACAEVRSVTRRGLLKLSAQQNTDMVFVCSLQEPSSSEQLVQLRDAADRTSSNIQQFVDHSMDPLSLSGRAVLKAQERFIEVASAASYLLLNLE